ncbi:MAG: glycosyl hydrolase [Actinomycetota bacterium]|nr:glycosyl hydrolase [Actinomycetota bacterium]
MAALVVAPLLTVAATQAGIAEGAPGGNNQGPAGLTARLRQRAAQVNNIHAHADAGNDTDAILDGAQQYTDVRTAPATSVSSAAFTAAGSQAAALGRTGGAWKEITTLPYNSDAVGYRDLVWSNSSGGNGVVTGRMTSLAVDGTTVYGGAAGGGVWRSDDSGATWTPLFDQQTVIPVGAVAVNHADHSVWVGTGEANFNFEAYSGSGIYRSADGGGSWQLVGNALDNSLVSQLSFDGHGSVYASTSRGLLKHTATGSAAPWTVVLKPDPNPDHSPYRDSFFTDVKVRPGTGGKTVLAPIGWRGGTLPTDTSFNGFYESTTGGGPGTWQLLTPTGDLAGAKLGRTTFSWSATGAVLYAVVETPTTQGLLGIYKSVNGDPAGPWTFLADSTTFTNAGSALALSGGAPGGQAWYDQYVVVDPADANHVYVGLEEVFETSNGGATWATTGPYWNFPLPCWSVIPSQNTCPDTIHPDQHAAAFGPGGQVYFGSDGGVWRHKNSDRGLVRWTDLNANLRTLQYYSVGTGTLPGRHAGTAVWGGLQDNGVSLLQPGQTDMVSPFGGDGGQVLIDPNNGNRAVNEYVYLSMASTTNGGQSPGVPLAYKTISPSCKNPIYVSNPCDPNPRFIAPFSADVTNINHWVAGGQMVWDNQGLGWATSCSASACDWKPVHDLGTGKQISAIGAVGSVTYAGWCGGGGGGGSVCTPGAAHPFISGIDTNFGGTWHTVAAPNLPNRIPTSFLLDSSDPAHVVVTFGAFSRRWVAGGGVGHVFESTDGGTSWTDISGNLPDAPVNTVVLWHHGLVVGTDVGVFTTVADRAGDWQQLGQGLPNASTNQLSVTPEGTALIAATHGRGMWAIGSGALR